MRTPFVSIKGPEQEYNGGRYGKGISTNNGLNYLLFNKLILNCIHN